MAMCTTCVKVLPWLVGSKSTVVPAWDLLGALQDMILRCSRIGAGGGGCSALAKSSGMFFYFFTSPLPLSFLFCTYNVFLLFPGSLGKVLGPHIP